MAELMMGRREPGEEELESSSNSLFNAVYSELRQLAQQQMASERGDHTLQATALVHEAYLRLRASGLQRMDRPMFFHAAAAAMRRILIDHARSRRREKRGGRSA